MTLWKHEQHHIACIVVFSTSSLLVIMSLHLSSYLCPFVLFPSLLIFSFFLLFFLSFFHYLFSLFHSFVHSRSHATRLHNPLCRSVGQSVCSSRRTLLAFSAFTGGINTPAQILDWPFWALRLQVLTWAWKSSFQPWGSNSGLNFRPKL